MQLEEIEQLTESAAEAPRPSLQPRRIIVIAFLTMVTLGACAASAYLFNRTARVPAMAAGPAGTTNREPQAQPPSVPDALPQQSQLEQELAHLQRPAETQIPPAPGNLVASSDSIQTKNTAPAPGEGLALPQPALLPVAPSFRAKSAILSSLLPAEDPETEVKSQGVSGAPKPQFSPLLLPRPLMEVVTPEPGATYIQVAAVTRGVAEVFVEVMSRKGFRSFVAPGPEPEIYRVLIGPIRNTNMIVNTRKDLEEAGFVSFVRTIPGVAPGPHRSTREEREKTSSKAVLEQTVPASLATR